jgi:hypothetical protein
LHVERLDKSQIKKLRMRREAAVGICLGMWLSIRLSVSPISSVSIPIPVETVYVCPVGYHGALFFSIHLGEGDKSLDQHFLIHRRTLLYSRLSSSSNTIEILIRTEYFRHCNSMLGCSHRRNPYMLFHMRLNTASRYPFHRRLL